MAAPADNPDQNSAKPIRLFIAVHLPQNLIDQLRLLQAQIKSSLHENFIRWTRPDQIHLTLRFFGNFDPAQVSPLEDALRQSCIGTSPFELRLYGLGCFPDWHRPRVVWAGIGGALDMLTRLHSNIHRQTASWGQIEDRPFTPHLTLGRIKSIRPKEARALKDALESAAPTFASSWPVHEIALIQSILSSEGARHVILTRIGLPQSNP